MLDLSNFAASLEDRFFSLFPYTRQLKAANQELHAKLTAAIAGELTIQSFAYKKGKLDIVFKTKVTELLAQFGNSILEEAGAKNYVEIRFGFAPDRIVGSILILKHNGKSPNELHMIAEAQRNEAIAKLQTLEKELEILRSQITL